MKKSIFEISLDSVMSGELFNSKKQIIITGTPGTGKSFYADNYLKTWQEELRRERIISERNIKIDELLNDGNG